MDFMFIMQRGELQGMRWRFVKAPPGEENPRGKAVLPPGRLDGPRDTMRYHTTPRDPATHSMPGRLLYSQAQTLVRYLAKYVVDTAPYCETHRRSQAVVSSHQLIC